MVTYILAVLTGLAVIAADRYTKYLVLLNPEQFNGKTFIKGIIDLVYVENGGGAWGMLSGYTWILISVTAVIMLVCIALMLKYGTKNKLMFWAMSLVLSGGIGNMIDRIARGGYVVDFLHFTFFRDFPVFNVADIAIVIGAMLLILYFIVSMIKEEKAKKTAVVSAPESDRNDSDK